MTKCRDDGLSYRLAGLVDGPRLAQLRWQFDAEDHPGEELEEGPQAFMTRFLSFYEAALDSGRWFVWVAETDGRVVAHVWVYVIPKVPRPGRAPRQLGYVTNVFTEPTARNRGVGSHLLKLVVSSRRGTCLPSSVR